MRNVQWLKRFKVSIIWFVSSIFAALFDTRRRRRPNDNAHGHDISFDDFFNNVCIDFFFFSSRSCVCTDLLIVSRLPSGDDCEFSSNEIASWDASVD